MAIQMCNIMTLKTTSTMTKQKCNKMTHKISFKLCYTHGTKWRCRRMIQWEWNFSWNCTKNTLKDDDAIVKETRIQPFLWKTMQTCFRTKITRPKMEATFSHRDDEDKPGKMRKISWKGRKSRWRLVTICWREKEWRYKCVRTCKHCHLRARRYKLIEDESRYKLIEDESRKWEVREYSLPLK